MRKWIFGGIVFVGALVAWQLYLDYSTQRFIENLPKAPVPAQDLDESPAPDTPTPLNLTSDEPFQDMSTGRSEALDNSAAETTAPAAPAESFEDTLVEPAESESDTAGLSPELETFFLGVYLLEAERLEVVSVVEPMRMENVSIMFRQQEISRELSRADDPATENALYAERETLLAREQELTPQIFELQEQNEALLAERNALFAQKGIASWQEFQDIYGAAYQTWQAEQ